jgi:hypothetical protein
MVIWLMVFAGSVTALLLMRASSTIKLTRQEAQFAREELALDGAADTIAAERLFDRAGGQWSMAGSGTIDVGGVAVQATISPEDTRLNINRASPAAIDAELQSAGVERSPRVRVLGRLASSRSAEARATSMADLAFILGPAQDEAQTCLLDRFTILGGRSQAAEPGNVAETGGQPLLSGALFRLALRSPSGMSRDMIMRVVPSATSPVLISDWRRTAYCSR